MEIRQYHCSEKKKERNVTETERKTDDGSEQGTDDGRRDTKKRDVRARPSNTTETRTVFARVQEVLRKSRALKCTPRGVGVGGGAKVKCLHL